MNKTSEVKKHPMTVYLNEDEAYMVGKWKEYTNSKSTSEFLRKTLYLTGCCGIRLRIENPEATSIAEELHLFNLYLITAIDEILKHDEVNIEDIEYLRRRMDSLYDIISKCYRVILAERIGNGKKIERYLLDWADNLAGITNRR